MAATAAALDAGFDHNELADKMDHISYLLRELGQQKKAFPPGAKGA